VFRGRWLVSSRYNKKYSKESGICGVMQFAGHEVA